MTKDSKVDQTARERDSVEVSGVRTRSSNRREAGSEAGAKMDQEQMLELLKQTMKLNLEAMQTTMAAQMQSLTAQFAPLAQTLQANQVVAQNAPVPATHASIQLVKYDEGADIDTYLTTFERVATQNNWDRATWAVRLQAVLSGKAAEAVALVPLSESSNYDRVKEAVLRRFQVTPETYRHRFRTTTKEGDQSFTDFGNKLEQLMLKWLGCGDYTAVNDVGTLRTYIESILRKLVVEQYLMSVRSEPLRLRLRELQDPTLAEITRLSENFCIARKDERESARATGATQLANQELDRRWKGGRTNEATGSKPEEGRPEKSNGYFQGPCYRCGKKGHRANTCTNPRKEEGFFAKRRVSDAEEQGFRCNGRIDGMPVKVLVDSGATLSIVHSKFIGNNASGIVNEAVVGCVHGDHKTYPVRQVHVSVSSGGRIFEGNTEMAVSDSLPEDVIIGQTFPGFGKLCRSAVEAGISKSKLKTMNSKEVKYERPTHKEDVKQEKRITAKKRSSFNTCREMVPKFQPRTESEPEKQEEGPTSSAEDGVLDRTVDYPSGVTEAVTCDVVETFQHGFDDSRHTVGSVEDNLSSVIGFVNDAGENLVEMSDQLENVTNEAQDLSSSASEQTNDLSGTDVEFNGSQARHLVDSCEIFIEPATKNTREESNRSGKDAVPDMAKDGAYPEKDNTGQAIVRATNVAVDLSCGNAMQQRSNIAVGKGQTISDQGELAGGGPANLASEGILSSKNAAGQDVNTLPAVVGGATSMLTSGLDTANGIASQAYAYRSGLIADTGQTIAEKSNQQGATKFEDTGSYSWSSRSYCRVRLLAGDSTGH